MAKITEDEIINRFGYHKAEQTPGGTAPRHKAMRKNFTSLALYIIGSTSPSREQSLALTALQEAAMWATCSIAMDAPLVTEK